MGLAQQIIGAHGKLELTDGALGHDVSTGDLRVRRQPFLGGLRAAVHLVEVGRTGKRDEDRGRRLVVLGLQCGHERGADGTRQQRGQGEFPVRAENPDEGTEIHRLLTFLKAFGGKKTLRFCPTSRAYHCRLCSIIRRALAESRSRCPG